MIHRIVIELTDELGGYEEELEHLERVYGAEELPQGEWKHHNSYFKRCSICQKIVGFDYIEQTGEVFNFCPNCGAKMKQG